MLRKPFHPLESHSCWLLAMPSHRWQVTKEFSLHSSFLVAAIFLSDFWSDFCNAQGCQRQGFWNESFSSSLLSQPAPSLCCRRAGGQPCVGLPYCLSSLNQEPHNLVIYLHFKTPTVFACFDSSFDFTSKSQEVCLLKSVKLAFIVMMKSASLRISFQSIKLF